MTPDNVFGQAQDFPDGADFVFEQLAQRLDEIEAEFFGEPAHVVMELDVGGGSCVTVAGLNDIGIKRALGKKSRALDRGGFALKSVDELFADDQALLLRIVDAGERGE